MNPGFVDPIKAEYRRIISGLSAAFDLNRLAVGYGRAAEAWFAKIEPQIPREYQDKMSRHRSE